MVDVAGGGRGVRAAAAVSLGLAVAVLAAGCGSAAPAPPTARVERGTVATRVSASGALAAVTSQNMGFAKAAQLKEVDVKVGDIVKPGQVLGREDPFTFQQVLNQQQAQLSNQLAILDRIVHGTTVDGDHNTLDQAKKILSAYKHNADEIHDRDQHNLDVAKQALDQARQTYQTAKQAYDQDCTGTLGTTDPLCTSTIQTSYSTAQSSLRAAKNSYVTVKHTMDVDDSQTQISIETSRQTVVGAQNAVNSDTEQRGPNIDAQAAVVANNRALVAAAQRDVDNTVLYAPIGATVSAIDGAVGEWIPAGGGTSALAPGTDAAIPGVGAAATSDQSSASSPLSATRPGGSAFVVLNNINTFQVVVPFEESDAAKVAPNQKVQVNFDAIPNLTRDGTVLSIAPNGVNISGVTNYYATILLTDTDPRLRSGLTAETGVQVQEVDNVLTVPNSAIIRQGGKTFVNVPGPNGPPMQREFQPGMVGDDTTQVLSGLAEGQAIQLPQAQTSGPAGGGGRPGG